MIRQVVANLNNITKSEWNVQIKFVSESRYGTARFGLSQLYGLDPYLNRGSQILIWSSQINLNDFISTYFPIHLWKFLQPSTSNHILTEIRTDYQFVYIEEINLHNFIEFQLPSTTPIITYLDFIGLLRLVETKGIQLNFHSEGIDLINIKKPLLLEIGLISLFPITLRRLIKFGSISTIPNLNLEPFQNYLRHDFPRHLPTPYLASYKLTHFIETSLPSIFPMYNCKNRLCIDLYDYDSIYTEAKQINRLNQLLQLIPEEHIIIEGIRAYVHRNAYQHLWDLRINHSIRAWMLQCLDLDINLKLIIGSYLV